MIRQAAAIVAALVISSTSLYAQSTATKLTVSVAAADVHQTPSVGSPVIGKAPRGTALVVTREVGDWVKVSWPSAVDGAGYVRRSVGTIGQGNAATSAAASAPVGTKTMTPATAPAPTPVSARTGQVPTTARPSAPSPARTLYVAPTHIFAVGAVAGGSTMGFGASARMWRKNRLGVQLEVSRSSYDSLDMLSRTSTTDIAPSLLFAMNDHVTDYLWLRPYVGVAAHIGRHSRNDLIFLDQTESTNTLGARAFVGGELSLSSLPKFALSADVGYYHLPEPFLGFEPGGIGLSISAHWYLK